MIDKRLIVDADNVRYDPTRESTAGRTSVAAQLRILGTGSSGFTNSDSTPISPNLGDRWYKPSTSKLYTWVNDGSSSQWVEL